MEEYLLTFTAISGTVPPAEVARRNALVAAVESAVSSIYGSGTVYTKCTQDTNKIAIHPRPTKPRFSCE